MEKQFKPLRYTGYAILLEEVPDEISLGFNISGCTHKCKKCHSPFLWKDIGNLLSLDFISIVQSYRDLVSCVCFLGGDHNIPELLKLCEVTKKMQLKTCIYSGYDDIKIFQPFITQETALLDYLKIGPYLEQYGPLNNPTTNQRFYKIQNCKFIDITYNFQRRKI